MTPTPGTDRYEWAISRMEAETDIRAHTGPCLLCGTYQPVLARGRRGGLRVYCDICTIANRTDSMKARTM